MITTLDLSLPTLRGRLIGLLKQIEFLKECRMSGSTPSQLRNLFVANLRSQCAAKIAASRYWLLGFPGDSAKMLYDTQSRLMWEYGELCSEEHNLDGGEALLEGKRIMGTGPWRLPSIEELVSFASTEGNPLREGYVSSLAGSLYWLSQQGMFDIANKRIYAEEVGSLIACSDQVSQLDTEEFVTHAIQRGWWLTSPGNSYGEDPLASMKTPLPDLATLFRDIDHHVCRLPKLSDAQLSDPNLGLWEFFGEDPQVLSEANLRARDPVADVKDWNIAIDFGTSSSVVAYDDNGRYKLLRIGAKDHWEKEQPEHYENPTVLEFIDLQRSLEIWTSQAYRPNLNWDNLRCSHEALHDLRNNGSDPKVVASILSKIKHWALRHGSDNLTRISDQVNGREYSLPALSKRDVVKGKPLTVSQDDPLDPIELYAWYLGMAINWRSRGLFLRYYMTFPVAYSRDLKETILMSFRRGLQRSLPAQLLESEVFDQFCVEELANEPAAYAAAALPMLGIEPTEEGVAYGVFDFGGGTTDFDFGRYRLPTADEEDEGWEEVFEHYGNAGDVYLGGENLLENMAYLVFRENIELCRTKRIGFVRPLDAEDFPGSEMFLLDSQSASTNSIMLLSRLRPLWEQGALPGNSGVLKLPLLDREGKKIECELTVPVDLLTKYLTDRIGQGIQNFFSAMAKAFAAHPQERVHVLLAGNSSRSAIVQKLFESVAQGPGEQPVEAEATTSTVFGSSATMSELLRMAMRTSSASVQLSQRDVRPAPVSMPVTDSAVPAIVVHQPLASNPEQPYSPNGKTGVAIGLLRLAPGSPVKVISSIARDTSEAPFAHYVGRVQRGKFSPGLQQGATYDTWMELGVPRDGVFNLFHSQSPKAHTGDMQEGDSGLYKRRLSIPGNHQGHRIYAKAIGPHQVQVCTASSLEALQAGDCSVVEELDLAKV
ncbi:MAG: hypothetical protein E7F70_05165 [Pseudomonas aeruginosa]|jgi:hypothetical protein|uniref:hypothetical protein n=1 Tax=Pseudomonas aeruginosa TaxID=287 RepID=UPI00128F61C5|nr:hypothetical protein [Pseudomonas aeruginosa]DAL63649.1 MAG TPA_asm: putative heat shock protein [Bacteriophage sp.]MBG4636913.1 hypothetical protein [Pseudomonas aeruginosa]MBG4730400.1 hypothetical protein [Pseudomonas aeruginosa]MBH3751544.1 hypothetical protein [Pseudomonas aeruginosa]MBH8889594.1 hypothetical protein [Pseudomonas aeruginosa]